MFKRLQAWGAARWRTLDLVPLYLRAVIAGWNDILWLSIPAFPFIIWWFLGSPPTWLVALVLLWIFLIAGYYAWRADHRLLIPKITLRFENRTPFVQMTAVGDPEVTMREYFRVFPDCSTAVESQGYLMAVFREVDGTWQTTLFDEPLPLTWADGRTGPINIESGIGPYLKVFYVENYEKQIVPCIVRPTLRTGAVFSERLEEPRTTFRFDIKVTNGNRISLKVKMDERSSYWDRPFIEVLPDDGEAN